MKDGKTQFEEVGTAPTLDLALDKILKADPRLVVVDDYEAVIAARRRERAFRINTNARAPGEHVELDRNSE